MVRPVGGQLCGGHNQCLLLSSETFLMSVEATSGCVTAGVLDKTTSGTGTTSTSPAATSFTPARANEWVYSAVDVYKATTITISAGSSFTMDKKLDTSPDSAGDEWWNQTTATATTAGFSLSAAGTYFAIAAVAFYSATAFPKQATQTVTVTQGAYSTFVHSVLPLQPRQAPQSITVTQATSRNAQNLARDTAQAIMVAQGGYSSFVHAILYFKAQAAQAIAAGQNAYSSFVHAILTLKGQAAQAISFASAGWRDAIAFTRQASQVMHTFNQADGAVGRFVIDITDSPPFSSTCDAVSYQMTSILGMGVLIVIALVAGAIFLVLGRSAEGVEGAEEVMLMPIFIIAISIVLAVGFIILYALQNVMCI